MNAKPHLALSALMIIAIAAGLAISPDRTLTLSPGAALVMIALHRRTIRQRTLFLYLLLLAVVTSIPFFILAGTIDPEVREATLHKLLTIGMTAFIIMAYAITLMFLYTPDTAEPSQETNRRPEDAIPYH